LAGKKATEERKTVEEVIADISHQQKGDVFRSQFRSVRTEMYAVPKASKAEPPPIELIEWGLAYLDRRRKSQLEAQKADLEALEVNIRKRHIWLVAVVGAISGIGVIANILVNWFFRNTRCFDRRELLEGR
jgi:hypothetical protein